MRKTRRINYKKKYRKNKTITCRKNTRRCKYRRKRSLYGGGKETKPQPKTAKYHSGNIFDNIHQLTNKTPEDNQPLFKFAGKVTQARRVPDGPGLANTFASKEKITPAKEKGVLKGFKDEDLEK